MSIIEAIRNFIALCPLLKDGAINVDYLGDTPSEYTVDGVPTSEVIKRYADGGALKQYLFIFASREYYGSDTLENIRNSGFYEDFAAWLGDMSRQGALPELEGRKRAQKIEALTSGYLFDASAGNARYQIQCRLIYYED